LFFVSTALTDLHGIVWNEGEQRLRKKKVTKHLVVDDDGAEFEEEIEWLDLKKCELHELTRVVWAKTRGYSWWPAQITRHYRRSEEQRKSSGSTHVAVGGATALVTFICVAPYAVQLLL
jgi:hypothetical protein